MRWSTPRPTKEGNNGGISCVVGSGLARPLISQIQFDRKKGFEHDITTTTNTNWPTMLSSWRSLRAVALRPRPRVITTSQSPGWSGVMRSVSSTPGHHGTVLHDEENDSSELGAEFFGNYSVILPPEPFIFGVSRILQRPVPSHIARPSYVTPSAHDQSNPCVSSGDGRIQLGGLGEWRLRRAAQLAREVLEYAGTLVKVKAVIVVSQLR
jgi:hypothetical protein